MGKSSRRNKEAKPKRARIQFVDRPFEGLSMEREIVAMREILPAATLSLKTNAEYGGAQFTLVTMLPQMVGALRRTDGVLLVAMQTVMNSGDASLDLADRVLNGIELEAGETYAQVDQPEPGSRLQDILDPDFEPVFTLEEDFGFWVSQEDAEKDEVAHAIHNTRDQLIPTRAVPGVEGAYWARMQREFVRWVRSENEDAVLAALARLQTRRELSFDGARFVGAFRALGLSIPVFELDRGTEADELTGSMSKFQEVFDKEIANNTPLTPEERRAKSGIISRQVTLR